MLKNALCSKILRNHSKADYHPRVTTESDDSRRLLKGTIASHDTSSS